MSQKQPSLLERMRQGEKLTAAQQLELVVTLSIPAIMAQYRRGLQFKADHEPKFILTPQGRLIEELMKFAGELAKLAEPLE